MRGRTILFRPLFLAENEVAYRYKMEEIKETKKEDWNRFVIGQNGSFLQSYEWGEFQKSVGRQVRYMEDNEWQALIIKHELPLGKSYLYCPRGPVVKSEIRNPKSETNYKSQITNFLNEIKNLAEQENAIFVRIEPMAGISEEELKEAGFVKTKNVQPARTLILDLNQSEEELLAQMHEKTRYNIGLAARRGVTVKMTEYNEKDFDAFCDLLSATAKRQGIRIFGKEYYRKQLQIGNNAPHPPLNIRGGGSQNPPHPSFSKEGEEKGTSLWKREAGRDFQNLLFIAEYQDKAIAANMMNVFGQTATYLHGGSDNEFRALMAPHFLQWEQIKYAKNTGCKTYDFWGFDEQKWPGVSRFKKGFGGREVEWCGTHDHIFDKWWYRIYKAARSIL